MKTLMLLSLLWTVPVQAQPLSPQATAAAQADEDDELGPALVDLHASTRPFTLSPGADERYDRGIARMYRLEFDKAEEDFKEIVRLSPASPATSRWPRSPGGAIPRISTCRAATRPSRKNLSPTRTRS